MLKRLQGKNWHKVKDNYELLYVYTSDKGNIKGIYQVWYFLALIWQWILLCTLVI